MRILCKLNLNMSGKSVAIDFGIPDNKVELDQMFELRQEVYVRRKYFSDKYVENKRDFDQYDQENKCTYFIARVEGRIVGSVRLIQDSLLPTEKFFSFVTPRLLEKLTSIQKAEISRLVIVRHPNFDYFPRNIILLFFIYVLIKYARDNKISAGYAFLKKGIRVKLRRLKVPIHLLKKYEQDYPDDGMLERYFNEKNDKVIPMYFTVSEIGSYIQKIVDNRWIFRKENEAEFVLKDSVYTVFLKFLGVV